MLSLSHSHTHHCRQSTAGKTGLQKQLERLGLSCFLVAIVLGVVVMAVNRFKCVRWIGHACIHTCAIALKTHPPSLPFQNNTGSATSCSCT